MGKWTPEFKIHPDTWMHPETTENCIDTLLRAYGTTELNQGKRAIIRHFLKFGLKLNISTEEAKSLGIGGYRDSIGKYSTVSFQKGQYENAKQWFEKNSDHRNLALFGIKFWTFCRPSIIYTIKINQLQFHKRNIKQSNFFKSSESKLSCHIPDFLEFKTNKEYPKYIFDDDLVQQLQNYVKTRKEQGFKYLFWSDNTTNFTFENYTKLVQFEIKKDNELLKKMFYDIGCNGKLFETRANYAVRHVGVQHWLQLTNYDFDMVTQMGWDDINTLRQWYGKRDQQNFEKNMMNYFKIR